MNKNTTRITAIAGTTMALVIAATAAVSAAGPRDRDGFGFGFGDGRELAGGGMRGGMGFGGFRGFDADVERTERTVQTADGITVDRVEQGVADSASDTSLSFSLGSGEAVTVTLDEDTQVVAFEEQEVTSRRGISRTMLAPTEVTAADITAGSKIVVWSGSEDGADFVASRVVIQPVDDATDTSAEDTESTDTQATEDASATEDAATTDA